MPWQGSNLRPSGTDVQRPDTLPTELHGKPYIFIRSEAHAGAQPCLRYLVIRSWTIANLAPSVRSVKISAFLRLIRLSFSPTLPSALHYYLSSMSCDLSRRSLRIRNLPCCFRLYLWVGYRLFHSVGLSVSFAAVSIRYTYRLAPWLLYLLSDLNK